MICIHRQKLLLIYAATTKKQISLQKENERMPVFANSTETHFIIYNNRKINKQLNYNTKSEDINWQEKTTNWKRLYGLKFKNLPMPRFRAPVVELLFIYKL